MIKVRDLPILAVVTLRTICPVLTLMAIILFMTTDACKRWFFEGIAHTVTGVAADRSMAT
ncbi:MAG: hypothetical protein ABL918_00210 [Chakrabartia sp.]